MSFVSYTRSVMECDKTAAEAAAVASSNNEMHIFLENGTNM